MNCPNCGTELDWRIQITRMRDCPSCGSTCFLDGASLRATGKRGEMLDVPALFAIDRITHVGGREWRPIGHIRFSYGPGWWDEYWCENEAGFFSWISADEGDIAIEESIEPPVQDQDAVRPGARFVMDGQAYTATEAQRATCIAVRGQLPEVILVGETHDYIDFTGTKGGIVTFERWENSAAWFAGNWLDPWDASIDR
ncbi:MAG: DUF4178 domain-containing protein [Geminicoccaceae bacterium]